MLHPPNTYECECELSTTMQVSENSPIQLQLTVYQVRWVKYRYLWCVVGHISKLNKLPLKNLHSNKSHRLPY